MIEKVPHLELNGRISRRKLLAGSLGIAAAAMALRTLPEGISLSVPSLEPRPVFVREALEGVELISKERTEDGEQKVITITPEDRLIFEPSGVFFEPGKKFNYVHRGGNSFKAIREAYDKGADLFDIDANDVNGVVYGEHGVIPQLELRLGRRGIHLCLPAVFDLNEKEVKLGMPSTYEELIAYIASLNTDERRLAASVEIKRGKFESGTLEKMFAIHRAYNIPAVMHSQDSQRLVSIGNELAARYNLPG